MKSIKTLPMRLDCIMVFAKIHIVEVISAM